MKNILTIGLTAILGSSVVAQTQMIAHRSHSGKNKNFKINSWTNLGLGYTEEDLRRMTYDRFTEQATNIQSKMDDLEQEIQLNEVRDESVEKKTYAKTLSEMKSNLSAQTDIVDQISALLEKQRVIDSTKNAKNQILYAEMREKNQAGDKKAVAEINSKIQDHNTTAFKERNKLDKQRYALEQKYNDLSRDYNQLEYTSRTHQNNVKLLDEKMNTDQESSEEPSEQPDIIDVQSVSPNSKSTELAPMTSEDKKAKKRRLKALKKSQKKQKKAEKKIANKDLGIMDATEDSPQESGLSWWGLILILIIPAAMSIMHSISVKTKSK